VRDDVLASTSLMGVSDVAMAVHEGLGQVPLS
jgi:hypothetical protein